MNSMFCVSIYTPEKTILETQVSALVVPAALGYLGVLPHHAPLVSILTPGKIRIQDNTGNYTTIHSKGNGFMEILNNNATILLESV